MFTPNQFARYRIRDLITISIVAWLILISPAARAAVKDNETELNSLKQEIEVLRNRVNFLEKQLNSVLQLVNNAPASGGETKENNRITKAKPAGKPATESRDYAVVTASDNSAVNVGGRVKLDAIYNSHSVGGNSGTNSGDLAFTPSAIPINGTGEDDQISFNARQTRLWLKGYSSSSFGEMAGYLEIDFNSSSSASNEKVSNSYIPRLRHAYGTLGGITLGQTYTTFMNVSAFPEMNDLNGPAGIMNIRQPLFRYRFDRDWGNIYVALENPETTLTTAAGNRIAPDDDRVPDMVAKVEFSNDRGNWTIAGMAREIRSDGAVLANADDSAWGGAISTAGRIRVFKRDNLRFNISYGNALGRYLSYNAFDDGVIDNNGKIELSEIIGGYLAYQHWWSDDLRSSIGAGFALADYNSAVVPGAANKKFYSTHLNLIWNPSLNASIGIEWLKGYRELQDGRDGHIDRVQLTSIYNF